MPCEPSSTRKGNRMPVPHRDTATNAEIRCGTCLFFVPDQNSPAAGLCRYNPPAVIMLGSQQVSRIAGISNGGSQMVPVIQKVLPTMNAHEEWCGQWQHGHPYGEATNGTPAPVSITLPEERS